MNKTAIIDYDCGNIFSLTNALKKIGQPFDLVDDATTLSKYTHAILPGVGSFGPAISHLKNLGFDDELREFSEKRKTIFGICLGMQLLFSESHENGTHEGIGLIEGKVEKIQPIVSQVRVPNIGWSAITKNPTANMDCTLFDQKNSHMQYYFVHSFQAKPKDTSNIAALLDYGGTKLVAAVCQGHLLGVQFHPEKSGNDGLALFAKIQSEFWI